MPEIFRDPVPTTDARRMSLVQWPIGSHISVKLVEIKQGVRNFQECLGLNRSRT